MAILNRKVAGLMLACCSVPVFALAPSPASPDTRLVEAAMQGDHAAAETLLRSHVPVDTPAGDGSTALHWAAYQGDVKLAEELLLAHANANAVTRVEAITPLYMACQTGSASMIELLIAHGANPKRANALGTTPLMIASAAGNADAVKVLLDHGADVNARESVHDQTALMFAANLDRAEVIRLLLAHGADANLQSKVVTIPKIDFRAGNFAKAPAVKGKDGPDSVTVGKASDKAAGSAKNGTYSKREAKEAVAATDAKLTPGSVPNRDKKSDMVYTKTTDKPEKTGDAKSAKADEATGEEPKELTALRKARAEQSPKVMGGMTPLLYAARQGNISSGVALLEGGARINEGSASEQTTPLVLAIANGHYDFAKMLVEHGADVNLANVQGVTPLWATIDVRWVPRQWSPEPLTDQEKTNYLELMKLLLAHGATPNARLGRQVWSRVLTENRNWTDPAGSTAFWRAAQADDVDAMKLLVAGGADPNIPSKIGTTPLMMAAGLGWSANYHQTSPTRLQAIQYCLSLGADINAHDELGYTPLHGAAFIGDLKNIQYMVDHGAKTDVRTKAGDTPADMANGPFEKSLPAYDAVALLEKLGSPNSHNCRSSDCLPPVKEDKPDAKKAAE